MAEHITGNAWYGDCKYRLPCGYCELKKTDCDWWQRISTPSVVTIKQDDLFTHCNGGVSYADHT